MVEPENFLCFPRDLTHHTVSWVSEFACPRVPYHLGQNSIWNATTIGGREINTRFSKYTHE